MSGICDAEAFDRLTPRNYQKSLLKTLIQYFVPKPKNCLRKLERLHPLNYFRNT